MRIGIGITKSFNNKGTHIVDPFHLQLEKMLFHGDHRTKDILFASLDLVDGPTYTEQLE